MKSLIVLPSYNESNNIVNLIKELIIESSENFIVVVDDNSPDQTSKVIYEYLEDKQYKDRINIINRKEKLGRGSAVIEGFKWGLNNIKDLEIFIEMDCDFSHLPKYLEIGKKKNQDCDFVIGSRYPDGKIINWPYRRRVFSFLSNSLIRFLISKKIYDYTNGFRFYNRKSVEFLLSQKLITKGYINLSETAAILLKEGFLVDSFPIYFKNRVRGKSNLGFSEIISSLYSIFIIFLKYRFFKF